jgi:hypothetical protein
MIFGHENFHRKADWILGVATIQGVRAFGLPKIKSLVGRI